MARYRAVFRCFAGCPGEYPLTQPIYRCPTCDGLLEVAHDIDALRDRSAAAWMKLFDDRWMRTQWPYGSGVWGKREWVAPGVPDDCIVSTGEGGTNVFWAERLGARDRRAATCGSSSAATRTPGSFKDLGMTVLVSVVRQAIRRGRARDARALLREHGRHERVARGLRRGGRAARRGAPAARAWCRPRSSCSPSRTARASSRSRPTSTAAWPS